MKKKIIIVLTAILLFWGCASVGEREDYFFIPIRIAESGIGNTEEAAFNDSTLTFSNIENLSTLAFYRGTEEIRYKKSSSNGITLITTTREKINKFYPNTNNFLLMKTGFSPGSTLTIGYFMGILNSYYEYSTPNRYDQDIWIDINEIEGEYIEADYALLAVNTGSTVLEEIYIVDVFPEPVKYISSRYAVNDKFLPLNVELAQITTVEHILIEEGDKQVLVLRVIPTEDGILPGHVIEIIVSVRITKSEFMKEVYKIE